MRTISLLAASSLLALTTAFVGGCTVESESSSSSSGGSSGSTVPDGGTNPVDDTCTDKGLLSVTVTGLPSGLGANIKVTGAKTSDVASGSKDFEVPAGEYKIEAVDVSASDPIVRTLYRATISAATVTVCPTKPKVTVTYAPIATSGKLWMGNANGDATTLGYASSALGATATIPATVAAKTRGGDGVAFDKDGNLWTLGGTTADKTIARYPAASLGASGTPAPDREIGIENTGCSPLATAMAFDKTGNLWVSLLCENKIVRLTSAQLAASGTVTPAVEITGIDVAKGIAFDAAGNLWAADDQAVKRFDASRLGASIDSAANPADATLTMPDKAEYIAFDKDGNLWNVDGIANTLTRIAKADLAGTGASTPTPAVLITLDVLALPLNIAFDESGGVWVAASNGKFARLGASQLDTSTTAGAPTVPERVFTSDEVGSASDMGIFPAPAGLPLYHSVP